MPHSSNYNNFRETHENRPISEHPHGDSSNRVWTQELYSGRSSDPIERPHAPSSQNFTGNLFSPDSRGGYRHMSPIGNNPEWQNDLSRTIADIPEQGYQGPVTNWQERIRSTARDIPVSSQVFHSDMPQLPPPNRPDRLRIEEHYIQERVKVLRDASTRYPQEAAERILDEFRQRIHDAFGLPQWDVREETYADMHIYFRSHDNGSSSNERYQAEWKGISAKNQSKAIHTIAYTEAQIRKNNPNALPEFYSSHE